MSRVCGYERRCKSNRSSETREDSPIPPTATSTRVRRALLVLVAAGIAVIIPAAVLARAQAPPHATGEPTITGRRLCRTC